jgi:hypothetical protein
MVRPMRGLLALVLVMAASSPAAEAANDANVTLRASFSAKGYRWQLAISNAPDTFTLVGRKVSGGSSQTHSYVLGVGFAPTRDMASARITGGAGRMVFTASTRARTVTREVTGCEGTLTTRERRGVLTGLRIRLDNATFGTLAASRLAARIELPVDEDIACPPPPPKPQLALHATGPRTSLDVERRNGKVTESVSVSARVGRRLETHVIVAAAPPTAFTAAADLSTAHVDAAGPFLRGSLDFTRTSQFQGTLAGDFTAAFDSFEVALATATPTADVTA